MGDPVFCCREDTSYPAEGSLAIRSMQTALVRIAILTAAIQRSIYPATSSAGKVNSPIDLVQIRMHMAALNQWFDTLPPTLHLGVLLREEASPAAASSKRDRAIAFAERSSMLLGHCLYLSAMMLLTRRIFLSVVNDPDGGYHILHRKAVSTTLPPEKREALDYVSSCLMAANITGRIMGLMVSEDRLVSKCWMAIYPSFNACLLLLFHLTQRQLLRSTTAESTWEFGQLRGEDDADTVEVTENAKKCLAALEFCASGGDALSKWYLEVLAPFRKVLGEAVEREIRESVENQKGDMGQPGFNSLRPESPSQSVLSPTRASNITDDSASSSQPRLPSTISTRTVGPISSFSMEPQYPHPASGSHALPVNQCPISHATDDPAILSSHIYDILAVSAQGAFRLEDASRPAIAGAGYAVSDSHLQPQPPPAPPPRDGISSDKESSTSSTSASRSGTPLLSTRSISSGAEMLSNVPPTRAHSRTRSNRTDDQSQEGARLAKRRSSQSLQSPRAGEEHARGGRVKRKKMELYPELESARGGKKPSEADLIALLKRAA